jgi:hypothetical protein
VPEHEERPRLRRFVRVHERGPVWSVDLSCQGFA